MNIHSKALYQYLLAANVLHCSDEVIREAKREYRRLYKRAWKKRATPRKELRFYVTLAQYREVHLAATIQEIRPTTFAKRAVLAAVGIPYALDPRLFELLQLVSMAVIATSHEPSAERAHALLLQAETTLLTYLKTTIP